jgi:hypothetical protein
MSPTKSLGSGAHLFPIKVTLVCLLSALFITAADCHETLRARQGVNRAHRISTVVFDGAVNETVVGFVNGTVEYIYQYSLNASVFGEGHHVCTYYVLISFVLYFDHSNFVNIMFNND